MEKKYSNFNLKIKNLFIAFCRGVAGIQPILRDLSYTVEWIEHQFQNSRNRTVKPEMILSSNELEHTILLESKLGGNIDKEQYDRYKDITNVDLKERAYLNARCVENIDITYVIPEEVIDKAADAFNELAIDSALVSIGETKTKLYKNDFKIEKLNLVFRTGIDVNYDEIPTNFIPFDVESSEWFIAEKIFPIILSFLFENKSSFTDEDILREIIPLWSDIGSNEKGEMRKKILKVLRSASKYEFKEFIKQNKDISRVTHTNTWIIIKNPLQRLPSKRSMAWRQLKNLQLNFLERLKTGRGLPIQTSLFDDL